MPETSEAPQSGAALLARIRPRMRETTTQLCLRPDLLEAWEDAVQELALEKETGGGQARLASGVSKKVAKLADEVARLEQEIDDTAVVFRLRAVSKDKWQELLADNPPRKDNQVDQFYGGNRDAVLDAAVRLCMFDPVFEDCEVEPDDEGNPCPHEDCGSWQQFIAVCNTSEWKELRNAVNSVNGAVVDPPKSELASLIRSSNASGSKRLARGASVPASSTAG